MFRSFLIVLLRGVLLKEFLEDVFLIVLLRDFIKEFLGCVFIYNII